MKRFLDKIGNRGIGVNDDPANLAMRGFDQLGGYLTIEREAGDNRIRDVAEGIRHLWDLAPWDGVS